MTTVLAIGMGYCARHLAQAGGGGISRIIGTSRTGQGAAHLPALSRPGLEVKGLVFDGIHPSLDLLAAIEAANVLLLSAPPGEAGDPVLATLLQALEDAPRLKQVIYLTTLGVYGDHKGGWVDEGTPPASGVARLQRRLDAEAQWQAFGELKGVPVSVLRLAGIYGPGRNALAQLAAGEARPIHKDGQVFNRIHVEDITATILAALDRRFDGIVNVTDDLPASPAEPILEAARLLGRPAPRVIPFEEAAASMSPMALSFWASSKRVRNDRLKTELGVRLAHPTFRDGLAALYREGEGR